MPTELLALFIFVAVSFILSCVFLIIENKGREKFFQKIAKEYNFALTLSGASTPPIKLNQFEEQLRILEGEVAGRKVIIQDVHLTTPSRSGSNFSRLFVDGRQVGKLLHELFILKKYNSTPSSKKDIMQFLEFVKQGFPTNMGFVFLDSVPNKQTL